MTDNTNIIAKLLQPVVLPNGVSLPTPLAMAPMEIISSKPDGTASQTDMDYFAYRSDVAGLLISGAASVNLVGRINRYQLGIHDDKFIPNLQKLVQAAQQDGNRFIIQLQHSGRLAQEGFEQTGELLAPSKPAAGRTGDQARAMTEEDIAQTIRDFAEATRRAIEAGASGVEIQGANHYLLHQFFSKLSNQREDKWGGSLFNRMAFALAVTKAVKNVIAELAPPDFILGYRISPEEIHGNHIGFTFDECLELINQIAEIGVDYIHLSLEEYGGKDPFSQQVKERLVSRSKLMVAAAFTAEQAAQALQHADFIALGRATLIEPNFYKKIKSGEMVKIVTSYIEDYAKLPADLINWFKQANSPLPPLPRL
ncbi:NADH-dependent oxidoreductase [Caviibacterium pharyngocola]|uniref:NADH-dependent oxidoreductase n=1 Tax=Caviibacterium pharyngocola TaxID=28159 RepID=A0A2M8RUA8_9PAST|nr:NADH-dependent oxidoreductase [Caviibacterium pharyngocola]PJG82476.1 NADH-dependent oxidoreductase [Caviibacterium pharyngocola]